MCLIMSANLFLFNCSLHGGPDHFKTVAQYNSSNILEHFEAVKHATNNDHYMLVDDLAFIEFNKKYSFSGVKLLKNQFAPTKIPYATTRNYLLRMSIQLKLEQMEVAGLINFYMREYSNRKYLELMEEDEGPQKLRLDQLAIGFEAFLLFLGKAANEKKQEEDQENFCGFKFGICGMKFIKFVMILLLL